MKSWRGDFVEFSEALDDGFGLGTHGVIGREETHGCKHAKRGDDKPFGGEVEIGEGEGVVDRRWFHNNKWRRFTRSTLDWPKNRRGWEGCKLEKSPEIVIYENFAEY